MCVQLTNQTQLTSTLTEIYSVLGRKSFSTNAHIRVGRLKDDRHVHFGGFTLKQVVSFDLIKSPNWSRKASSTAKCADGSLLKLEKAQNFIDCNFNFSTHQWWLPMVAQSPFDIQSFDFSMWNWNQQQSFYTNLFKTCFPHKNKSVSGCLLKTV